MTAVLARRSAWFTAALVAGVGLGAPRTARPQRLTLQPPRGEAGADFRGFWIGFPRSPSQASLTFQEWIRVQLEGALGAPGLFAFTAGLQPTRTQTRWDGPLVPGSGGGDRVDVRAQAVAFAAAPASLALRRTQSRTHEESAFGTSARVNFSETGAGLMFRLPYLPGALDYTTQSRDATFWAGDRPAVRQAETVRTARLTAQNSKVSAFLEHLSFEDHAFHRDFKQGRSVLTHTLAWGKRSSLLSSFQYLDRTGALPFRQATWSERLHVQHTWKLASEHQYRRSSLQSGDVRSVGRSGRTAISYRFTPDLSAGVEGLSASDRFEAAGGNRTRYRTLSQVRYTRVLPLRARLVLTTAVGYEWDRQQPSAQGSAAVVNEPHVIDASQRFQLDQLFAQPGTVVVTSADETVTYQDGFDYRLETAGALLEVLVLPSGRIVAGDTVLVDYRFDRVPAGRSSALIAEYGAHLTRGDVTLYHRRSRFDRRGDGGTAALLPSRDDATTGLRVSHRLSRGAVDAAVEHQRRRSDFFDFTSDELRGSVAQELTPVLQGAMGADFTWSHGGATPVTLRTLSASLGWTPRPSLRLVGRAAAWAWSERGVRSQRFAGGGIEAAWRLGQARLELQYDGGAWNEEFEHTQSRLLVRVLREF